MSENCSYTNQNYAYANYHHFSDYSQIINTSLNNQNCKNTIDNGAEIGKAQNSNFQLPYYPNSDNGMHPKASFQSNGDTAIIQPIPGLPFTPKMPDQNNINNTSLADNSIEIGYYGNKKKQRYISTTFRPTLQANLSTDPAEDALALNKAYKGIGCNKEAVRNIIARRNLAQRERIKQEYNKRFGKCLIEHTKSELTEPYERVIISLLWTGPDLDAFMMYKASKGLGTDDSAYRDIICTRSFEQLSQIKKSYQNIYNKNLENVVSLETSGCYRDILLHLLNNPRDQSTSVDLELASKDASEFHFTKVSKISDPSSLMNIFSTRNNRQLLQTFIAYQAISGKTVYNYLKQFISSDYQKCLMTIHNFIANPIRYYSKELKHGILKKSINQIIRVVTTRCEFDLFTIIEDYNFTYKANFANDLKKEFIITAGKDTIDTIFTLIGANSH